MINKWCCMIEHHVTNPPTHKSSTEVVVDGPLRQPMVCDLDYTYTFSSLFRFFFHLNLIGKCTWLHHSHGINRTTCMIFQHDGDRTTRPTTLHARRKTPSMMYKAPLASVWWYSYPLISYVLAQSTHAALQAHFIWNIQPVQYPKKFSSFSLVTQSWKITALNTFNSDIFFWYLWCSTKKCVKVHCSCQQPVRVTRNDMTQKFNRLNRWTSSFHNFSRFPFCKSLNHFNMLLNSVRAQWLK